MAIVEELFESRVGGTKGVDASSGNARIFRVTTDDRDDDPLLDLRRDDVAKANLGAEHPWDNTIVCRNYAYVQKLTHKTWIIAAIYEPRELLSPSPPQGWIMRARSSSMTELLVETLPLGRLPKSRETQKARRPVDIHHIGIYQELEKGVKVIGPYSYRLATDAEVVAGTYTHVANDGGTPIELVQTKRRKQIGYQRTRPAIVFTLDKDVGDLPWNWGGLLASYMETVNLRYWLGADAGHIMFKDASVDPISGTIAASQQTAGIYWHVQLVFLWSSVPQQPLTLTHTYPDDFGNVLMVGKKGTGAKVIEDFHVAMASNFDTLLGAFQ